MKLVSYLNTQQQETAGLFIKNQYVPLQKNAREISISLPQTMGELLKLEEKGMDLARQVEEAFIRGKIGHVDSQVSELAPVPYPTSCRDGYAFRQHVETSRRNRGLAMIPEFDQFPVFYFTNHNAIVGQGDVILEADHFEQLDFELEAAIVIGKKGHNIPADKTDSYIAGLTIMNDLSARVLQMDEMKLNLGPAKGKDFATAIGPWLVTPDELAPVKTASGLKFNLRMTARHNGKQVSEGNLNQMNWTFAQIIERASYGVDLFPGDVIGSGTVGTGCYLELNGTGALTAKERGENFKPTWLVPGDVMELSIEKLGTLTNRTVRSKETRSILAKKTHA